jgi:ferrous iron transport protein A
MMPLGLLSAAERAEVVEVKSGRRCAPGHAAGGTAPRSCQDRVEDMGVRVGKIVEVLSNEGRGPILLKVDESRIAMGRGMAMKIMVRRT